MKLRPTRLNCRGLNNLACWDLELTPETMNSFKHFGRTHWTGDRPVARPLPTQDSRTQKNETYVHVSSEVRTHDPRVRAVQAHRRLRSHVGYGLEDWGSRIRFPAGAGKFSLHHCVQNGSGAHPASYLTGTRGSFSGGKAAGAWSWLLTSI
jgi:hypothetical protein